MAKLVVAFCALTALLTGCVSTRYTTGSESRCWDVEYVEKLKIMTEPSGAKIYVEGSQTNYVGESPVETTLNAGKFRVTQHGTYRQQYQYDSFAGTRYGYSRVGGTDWSGSLTASPTGGGWTIRAFMDGYEPAETRIVFGKTDAFWRAVKGLKVSGEGKLRNVVTGHNAILLTLKPLPSHSRGRPTEQQQQQQQQTVVIPGNQGQGDTKQMGTVMVSSNVQGADVYVDGVFVGNTPANLKLKDGIHIIEVKKSGYSTYRRELRVFGGSELSLRAELTK